MIQRIQTLYLFLVVALGITLCFVPVLQFDTPADAGTQRMWELSALGFEDIMPVEGAAPVQLQGLAGLLVMTVLIPLLALVDIFLFKKRLLQARLNIFTILLCLGYYGVLGIYIWLASVTIEGVEWHILPWASIPLVCFVLTSMATRAILKDEALVRAADRLR
ncbi:MAG: DUF4293 domain-containing protein [Paludibacteraceae bacterium]|nr:DUF4293 domain-containing protein [Paludibacteraceae bacterium]MBQ2521024.1 DUF4293 domain-containing protein [Paludibacteraceae bacterium]MBQ5378913.1 DUF4293 domain-containing protein [Paludibacteraceae bacterium]